MQPQFPIFLLTCKIETMKKLFFILGWLCAIAAVAQHEHPCGQVHALDELFEKHPEYRNQARNAAAYLEEYTRNFQESRGGQTIYTIPVVFHVVHNYGSENISDDQILDGLAILNRDFRKMNSDTVIVVDAFDQLVADAGIEFKLATKDPNGNCTSGITRTVSDLTTVGDQQVKDLIMWPRNEYLNIWVVQNANGAAGYSNLPPNVAGNWGADTDGIVVRSDYVGAIGTSSVQKSRTLTHEAGHWLNLKHTWGDGNEPALASNCDMDDDVEDTPLTIGWTSCNLQGASCGSALDNVQNYMEYSYCSRMFTIGQAERMRAALTSSVAQRNQLITASNLAATGVSSPSMCVADFEVDKVVICAGENIAFNDNSYNAPTTWNWNFGDGNTLSGTDPNIHQNPIHTYEQPGIYTVTLVVGNNTGSLTKVKTNLIHVFQAPTLEAPIWEGFEEAWPNTDRWSVWNQMGDAGYGVVNNVSYSGTKSLRLLNSTVSIIDSRDELISAPYDMSGRDTIYISYKWAWANKTVNTNDRFRISASADCGQNWGLVKIHQGISNLATAPDTDGNFVPSGQDQWGSNVVLISNPNYMSDHFQVKFEFVAKGGNNLYIDDINVYGQEGAGILEDLSFQNWSVYPNPAHEDMTIETDWIQAQNGRFELYDALGQLVWSHPFNSAPNAHLKYTLPHQTAGLYMLMVKSDNKQSTKRVIFK